MWLHVLSFAEVGKEELQSFHKVLKNTSQASHFLLLIAKEQSNAAANL